MAEKIWFLCVGEVRATVIKDIPGLVGWQKGKKVYAKPGTEKGEWIIRPEDRLGPTTVGVPRCYLRIKRRDLRALSKPTKEIQSIKDIITPENAAIYKGKLVEKRMSVSGHECWYEPIVSEWLPLGLPEQPDELQPIITQEEQQ